MADRKRGSEEGEGAGGGVAGGGEGDSKPFGHEMMLKEVKLLESVENEGPKGWWVKVERVGVGEWGRWGVGMSDCECWVMPLDLLALVLIPLAAMRGLPEHDWAQDSGCASEAGSQ